MLRRLLLLASLVFAALAITPMARPELAYSARDRLIRLATRVAPEVAERWRRGDEPPLEKALADGGFALGREVFIRIFKEERELELWLRHGATFELFRSYPICNWSGDLGPRLKEGDGQSPEGFCAVGLKQLNPNSAYFRALNLGFPNAFDQAHGRTGSFLMIHGDCLSIGCYAMTDKGIDDIYRLVEAALRHGQREASVHVFPFRMTGENLAARAGHRWAGFWTNLKQGYDLFEATRMPPTVEACGGVYAFGAAGARCEPIRAW